MLIFPEDYFMQKHVYSTDKVLSPISGVYCFRITSHVPFAIIKYKYLSARRYLEKVLVY